MAEPATALARWLPTMLGGLLAITAVMAYELDWIPRDPAPPDCPPATPGEIEERRPASGPRDPWLAGARPHPSARMAEDDALALEDQLAALKAQAELLAERNVTGELGYYGMSQAELEAMARHCDVRTDYPTRLGDQEVEDLGLDVAEREAWDRAIASFAAQELELYRELLRELAPDTPELDTLTLAQVRKLLTKQIGRARGPDDDALQRHVAEERAGLREPPSDPSTLSAWNRYNRLRFNAGDRFAMLLADELGDARAEELRRAMEGWPGARTRQWGCPGESGN